MISVTSLLAATVASFVGIATQVEDVATGTALVCANATDAKEYASIHRDSVQNAIESQTDGKSCLVADVAFLTVKQSDRMRLNDATYVLTEILVIAIKTPFGYLSLDSSPAYTLVKVEERSI
jgi:hypothetical protein